MYIDIDATSGKEAAEAEVKIGDPVVPFFPFSLIHDQKVLIGKAFDDTVGAFIMMETIRGIKENEIKHHLRGSGRSRRSWTEGCSNGSQLSRSRFGIGT